MRAPYGYIVMYGHPYDSPVMGNVFFHNFLFEKVNFCHLKAFELYTFYLYFSTPPTADWCGLLGQREAKIQGVRESFLLCCNEVDYSLMSLTKKSTQVRQNLRRQNLLFLIAETKNTLSV